MRIWKPLTALLALTLTACVILQAAAPNPWKKALLLTDTSPHSLLTLMQAKDAQAPSRCASLKLFLDVSAPGDLYIGNIDVSTTNFGDHLVPTQYYTDDHDASVIPLGDIYLLATANTTYVGVTCLAR